MRKDRNRIEVTALFLHEQDADRTADVPVDLAQARAQTAAVTTIILFQILYLLNCRSLTQTIWRIGLFSNRWIYTGIPVMLGLQLALFIWAFQPPVSSRTIDAVDWIRAVAMAGFLAVSLKKWFGVENRRIVQRMAKP